MSSSAERAAEIERLCREETSLREVEIARLIELARSMENFTDLVGGDLFIDCLKRSGDEAVVVAHAAPTVVPSLYARSAVGKSAVRANEGAVFQAIERGVPTRDMLALTQEARQVRQYVSPVKGADGRVIAALIAEKDITESRRMDAKLHALAGLMESSSFSEYVSEGVILFDRDGVCTYVNPTAEAFYRESPEASPRRGDTIAQVLPGVVIPEEERAGEELLPPDQREFEIGSRMLRRNIYREGDGSLVMLLKDISELKEKERELVLKSTAISEIHHRIKNNLQTVASLLRLQKRRLTSREAKEALEESISRVLSMAEVHQTLSGEDGDQVDILFLAASIARSVVAQSPYPELKLRVDGESYLVPSEAAATVALVINEVVQNALKYAAPSAELPEIALSVERSNRYGSISIRDNGDGIDEESAAGLGMKIIDVLVTEKLKGRISRTSGREGTTVRFDFLLV